MSKLEELTDDEREIIEAVREGRVMIPMTPTEIQVVAHVLEKYALPAAISRVTNPVLAGLIAVLDGIAASIEHEHSPSDVQYIDGDE